MRTRFAQFTVVAALLFPPLAFAQSASTSGALIIVPATGTVIRANDEAHATFMVEEQDKDKAAAASRVNQKIKQGIEILKREDPQARLKTRGYYTYAVYADEQQPPRPLKARQLVGWRVGQYVEATTANLGALPRTVAAAQSILALNGLRFGLSEKTARSADDELIAAAYGNLTERIASIARAMGRSLSEAAIDTVDYEGSGNYAQQPQARMAAASASAMGGAAPQVEEPSFEPGETTLQMRVVGRVKFK